MAKAPEGASLMAALDRYGTRAALVATLLLPFLLIHARAVAEGVLAALAAGVLLRAVLRRDASLFRGAWVLAAFAYWIWLVLCTLLAGASPERIVDALVWVRIPLAILALSGWVLAAPEARRWLLWSTGLATAWVALELWLQFLFGRGILGFGRWPAGMLPGPFTRPRAGPFLVRLMWPPLIACAFPLLHRPDLMRRVGGWALLAGALATIVLTGQRLPVVFAIFGLGVAALLLPGLRLPALAAGLAGGAALAASAVMAPSAFHRLVVVFADQLAHVPDSHYGQILARSLEMARQHPLTGLGYEAFRAHCPDPRYFAGWQPGSDGGGAAMCVLHAHNPYLEALTDAGWPGLAIFTAFALLLLHAAWRGLPKPSAGRALRVGLFIAVLIPLWPLTSGSAFASLPTAGVWILLTGWALAEVRARWQPGPELHSAARHPA
jgi:O-antigen ligase